MAEKEKKKYAICISFSRDVEGDNEADAIAHASYDVAYGLPGQTRNLMLSVIAEVKQEKAIKEAPYADQVTVHESDGEVEQPPFTTAIEGPALEPPSLATDDGSGLPPVSTATTELVEAFTKPAADEIPF